MSDFRADLHCHTTVSDGTQTPEQVVLEAKRCGLSGLSITDHDTIDAYASAIPVAKDAGIELVSGVEFSTKHMGVSVHVLAYGFSLSNPSILSICEYHKERRSSRFLEMLGLLSDKGFVLDNDQFDLNDGTIGRPHLAKALLEKGYVQSIKEAFNKYLADEKCCYVASKTMSTEETLQVIREANAFSVIAHPHLIKNQDVLLDLLKLPFDGIEAYYARFAPSQEKQWVRIGEHRGWLITGGSDFHGDNKPNIPLGCSWVGHELFYQLKQRFEENQSD